MSWSYRDKFADAREDAPKGDRPAPAKKAAKKAAAKKAASSSRRAKKAGGR